MSERKPISKKLRFDIFKRDSFSCLYCGQTPPAVVLEVDHIIPVCKGGGNNPDNLVTACFSCNRGKGGVPLTVTPESLSDQAERIKEGEAQLKAFRKVIKAQKERIEADAWSVVRALYGESRDTANRAEFLSIKKFLEKLPVESVSDAAETAYAKFTNTESRRFKYFCGICWNIIRSDADA